MLAFLKILLRSGCSCRNPPQTFSQNMFYKEPGMTINLQFSQQDWQRIERDWCAWWNHELDRPLVLITQKVEDPDRPLPYAPGFASTLPFDMPADELLDRYQPHFEATRFYGDAMPRWWLNFGPGIAAGFLGAKVHPVEDTVWFGPSGSTRLEDQHYQFDPNNPWWLRVKDITQRAADRWQGQMCISHTDLGGNLDILASFVTTDKLLTDVIDSPEQVDRLVQEITATWLHYYDALYEIIQQAGTGTTPWAPVWSPGRTYMLQCDFSYMISPKMFERFVMPDLAACCDQLDHGFYHLDGKGQIPHLKYLLSLERLRGIQWIPGDGAPPPQEWLPLLQSIREGGKLCQLFVSAEGARTIVREIGGKGFVFSITENMNEQDAQDYIHLLAREDKNAR
jgi:hypothetical protein